ncbi:MAG: toxin co-regulated pilus biosynthesis Q family protein [Rickettsiales bacterium]|jgi:hypothetical protein|nr:toxin co-regulated pilus biosynthesis Q family protein [Rickettsiales bacterium]
MKKILAFVFAFAGFAAYADGTPGPDANYADDPVWPAPYTESYKSADERAANPDAGKPGASPRSATGWTGGANNATQSGGPPVTSGIIPSKNSAMPLANKSLINDAGARTISASAPPGSARQDKGAAREIVNAANASAADSSDAVDVSRILQDSIRDWVAKEGMTMREVLQQWCDIEGWELVWDTKREYPLKASAIFRGRFKDVSAALIRTFAHAAPQPLAKYYLGNRVLVVKTQEENDDN